MGTIAKVARARRCQICEFEGAEKMKVAEYDLRTKTGQWAFVCGSHRKTHAAAPDQLGTGIGQKLVLETCGHTPYTEDKCAEMLCSNYVMKSGA